MVVEDGSRKSRQTGEDDVDEGCGAFLIRPFLARAAALAIDVLLMRSCLGDGQSCAAFAWQPPPPTTASSSPSHLPARNCGRDGGGHGGDHYRDAPVRLCLFCTLRFCFFCLYRIYTHRCYVDSICPHGWLQYTPKQATRAQRLYNTTSARP